MKGLSDHSQTFSTSDKRGTTSSGHPASQTPSGSFRRRRLLLGDAAAGSSGGGSEETGQAGPAGHAGRDRDMSAYREHLRQIPATLRPFKGREQLRPAPRIRPCHTSATPLEARLSNPSRSRPTLVTPPTRPSWLRLHLYVSKPGALLTVTSIFGTVLKTGTLAVLCVSGLPSGRTEEGRRNPCFEFCCIYCVLALCQM